MKKTEKERRTGIEKETEGREVQCKKEENAQKVATREAKQHTHKKEVTQASK